MNRYPGQEETICAIATPPEIGSIGIIRVSGKDALSTVQRIFRGSDRGGSPFKSHTMRHGFIVDPASEQPMDEALVVVMKGPRSYTGEDVVEIQSHGNPSLLQKILSLLIAGGARLAQGGEFTRRAFLSGRIDLAQAEAVMELILAQSQAAQELALNQLRGDLSRRIHALHKECLSLLSSLEASMDFLEQGITLESEETILARLRFIDQSLRDLLAGYEEGRQIREGSSVVIVGRPNVGKSSLFNQLLGEERAIVTPIPGTTRDTLSEGLFLSGRLVQMIDTAGFHATTDPIEQEGMRRGEAALKNGDLILFVLDSSEPPPFHPDDLALENQIGSKKKILVFNKSDLPLRMDIEAVRARYPKEPLIFCSAWTGKGLCDLKNEMIEQMIAGDNKEKGGALVALLRHKNALARASDSLQRALQAAQEEAPVEFLAADLREGLTALGEIVGITTTDEILDQIFSQFCIGK